MDAPEHPGTNDELPLPVAASAIRHLNTNHPDALLLAARAFAGHPDATSARAERVDRRGIDIVVATPAGPVAGRVGFAEPVADREGLRAAFGDLAARARAVIGDEGDESSG